MHKKSAESPQKGLSNREIREPVKQKDRRVATKFDVAAGEGQTKEWIGYIERCFGSGTRPIVPINIVEKLPLAIRKKLAAWGYQ